MKIEKYQAKGKTKYRFQAYLGIDDLTGKPLRVQRAGFDSKKEAEIVFLALKLKADDEIKERRKFKDVYEEWLEQYRLTVKSSTLNKTKELFKNHIKPELGNYYVGAITLKQTQKATNKWAKKLVKYREVVGYASSVFDHAIRSGLISDNPFRLVIYPTKKKVEKKDNYYDKNELKKFLELAERDMSQLWFTYFRLLAFTGLRKSEALSLTWADIDFKKAELTVNKTLAVGENNTVYVSEPKTEDGHRLLHLDKVTLDILRSWRLAQIKDMTGLGFNPMSKSQLVFATLSNKPFPLSNPNHRLASLIKKHGLKEISPHGFRHTHCSMLFEAGATIPEVQKRLGHKDIKVTMNIYNHVTKYKQQEAVEKLAEYLAF